jgi:hypothetical protein
LDKTKLIKYGLGLMSLLLGGMIGWSQADLLPLAQADQQSPQILISPEFSSTSAPATPLPLPTPTVTPSTPASSHPTPTIEWTKNPVCKNLPQDLAAWLLYAQQSLSDPTIVTQLSNDLRQAQLLDPLCQASLLKNSWLIDHG